MMGINDKKQKRKEKGATFNNITEGIVIMPKITNLKAQKNLDTKDTIKRKIYLTKSTSLNCYDVSKSVSITLFEAV